MPKKAREMSAIEVKRLSEPGFHAVGGVAGLHLRVTESGARSWVLRASIVRRRRDIGLGGFPDVPLAHARDKARTMRKQIEQGLDPVRVRKEARSALAAARAVEVTFDMASRAFINSKCAEWRSGKTAEQWETTLATYASPVVGKLLIRDIELAHLMKILEPIWTEKTTTANRVRGRIENILDWGTAHGHRKGDNPARWRGLLDKVLPGPGKIHKVEHLKALPVNQIGQFMQDLRALDVTGAKALEFLILTAARSGEVRGSTWSEIGLREAVWTIPAARMKADREHRVPLAPVCVELLESLPRFKGNDFVFPAARGGKMHRSILVDLYCKMVAVDITVHGFRSTFRDWAAENTNFPNQVAEMALAHAIGNKVEAAYRRGDLFEKRRRLMNKWAEFCSTVQVEGKVIKIRGGDRG